MFLHSSAFDRPIRLIFLCSQLTFEHFILSVLVPIDRLPLKIAHEPMTNPPSRDDPVRRRLGGEEVREGGGGGASFANMSTSDHSAWATFRIQRNRLVLQPQRPLTNRLCQYHMAILLRASRASILHGRYAEESIKTAHKTRGLVNLVTFWGRCAELHGIIRHIMSSSCEFVEQL